MMRVTYVIIGPYTHGWRDVPADRGVTVQRDGVLHPCHVDALQPGDVARGVNHSRIITGPPVRIVNVRKL